MPIATPQGTLDFKSVDKVTFVGASSNTVIDTTTGSLGVGVGVGGPTSNLHVVGHTRLEGDINMLHTSNTASIKLNSNVVAEFPRSKKLIKYPRVALTAASGESSGYQGYYVTESSNSADTDRHSWKAFENTTDNSLSENAWANDQTTSTYSGTDYAYNGSVNLGTGAVNGEWIKLQLPHKIRLEYMKIWVKDNDSTRIPEDWRLYGSDDNSNWTELFSKTGQGAINENLYNVNATSMYNYLAVVVTKIAGQPNYFRILELEYFGTPEYDPEAHGTDVTVKSYPNVPNTDWLELRYDAENYSGAGDVQDETGNNSGGILDGVTYDSVSKSFTFDGGDKIYRGPMTAFTSGTSYTASIWFKIPEIVTNQYILFHFGHGTSGESFGLNIQRGNVGAFLWGGSTTYTTDNLYSADEWVNAACTINGSIVNVYLNGTLQLSYTQDIVITIPTNPCLSLGIHFNGEQSSFFTGGFFIGSMANFRLYNRDLTSDEIYQLYAHQKEYFGHGDLSMTLKAGRLGIGTSEPRAALDVRGRIMREYNPGEIIETIQTRADGQNVRVLSGTYSIQNVTSLQDVTTSHTIVTGSSISYKPPPGTTRVIYEFYVYVRLKDPDVLIHFAGRLAGTQVSHTRSTFRSRDYEQQWVYNNMTITIGDVGSDNLANGKLASWTTNKTIDFTCRDYTSGYEAYLHGPEHWDGGGTSIKITPFIKITAIA